MCPDAWVCVGSRCSQSDNQKDLLLMKIAISLVNNEQSWHREDDIQIQRDAFKSYFT